MTHEEFERALVSFETKLSLPKRELSEALSDLFHARTIWAFHARLDDDTLRLGTEFERLREIAFLLLED